MRRTLVLAALPLLAVALPARAERTLWKRIDPADTTRATKIAVTEKSTPTYYALEGEGEKVRLTGPSRIRVSARLHFAKEDPASREFTISASMDGKDLEAHKFKVGRSKSAKYAVGGDGAAPGALSSFILDVPEGDHAFVFKSDAPAHATFSRPTKKKKPLRTEMTPTEFAKAVEMIYQEREQSWYFATKEKAVAAEIHGPTTLDVYAVLNFDASMRATMELKVEALIDGKVEVEKTFKTSKSHVRSYPDEKSLVPGQENNFQVAIPAGKHRVELRLKGDAGGAFRILIPTKDLKNGD